MIPGISTHSFILSNETTIHTGGKQVFKQNILYITGDSQGFPTNGFSFKTSLYNTVGGNQTHKLIHYTLLQNTIINIYVRKYWIDLGSIQTFYRLNERFSLQKHAYELTSCYTDTLFLKPFVFSGNQ